ncbi:MAG: anaerobic selenocysteine-containing dehydrogenase [Gammaproteobacteria bacterium]|jgi:anaerobic selenocysteine-containing dehydrogenase
MRNINKPTIYSGICPHDCPDACGIETEVQDGRAIKISAQKNHPIAANWLCAKVSPYLDRVYHPERLKTPLRRIGPKGSGQWEPISWTAAIDEIKHQWGTIIQSHGAEAILPYSYSGTLGLVQMTVASARFWNRLGASQLERSICMAATRHAVRATLGARMSPPYQQVEDSKLLIFWGHNPVSTAPHLMPFVKRAREKGCKLVVIDPRYSRSSKGADYHLRPLPGTDGALALGLAREIMVGGYHNQAWIDQFCHGWPQFRDQAIRFDLERVSEITGIKISDIKQLAELFGQQTPTMIRMGDSLNRNIQGGQTVRAIACLPALTGQYGIRGGGLSCSTGDYFIWNDESINRWKDCPAPGRIINMNRLGFELNNTENDPPIQSLFVFCANPMVSTPNTAEVKKGLMREDLFTVVHDLFMTDTARYADIVLPATSQLEQVDLHRGYGHTYLGYNHPAIAPIGESKSNWDVMQLLSRSMDFEDDWLYETPDQIIEGVLEATQNDTDRVKDISLKTLQENGFQAFASEDEVPFSNGHYATASGKIELHSEVYEKAGLSAVPDWKSPSIDPDLDPQRTLHLVSPAAHHFVNSSMANLDGLLRREKEPKVLIHTSDASRMGIENNKKIRLSNANGYCDRTSHVSDDVRPGVAIAVNGFWQNDNQQITINWTTSDVLADVAGQSTFQSNCVEINLL